MPTRIGPGGDVTDGFPTSRWPDVQHAVPVTSDRFDAPTPPLRVKHDLHAWPAQREQAILTPPPPGFSSMPQPPCELVATPPPLVLPAAVPVDTAESMPPEETNTAPAPAPSEPASPSAPVAEHDAPTAAQLARIGQRWWQHALQGGPDAVEALDQAANAFTRAMALEPARADVLGAMLSRCHLAQARLTHGDARIAHLDAALAAQQSPLPDGSAPSRMRLHRAETLYERALAVPRRDRQLWLDMASATLAGRLPTAVRQDEEQAERLSVQVQIACAELVSGRQRETLFAAAVASLATAVERADTSTRDEWLALLIDCQQRHLQCLHGAARAAAAQRTRAWVAPWLAQAVSLEPLLAWLRLLATWADGTQGGLAADRHAEVEQMLERAGQVAPDARAGIDFARACHLRLRARAETGGRLLPMLREALRLLDGLRDPQLPPAIVALEAAQLHLAAAQAIRGDEAAPDLHRAVQLADTAARSSAHRADALRCALNAQLLLARLSVSTHVSRTALFDRVEQLRTLGTEPAVVLGLRAEVELSCGQYASACATCSDAWNAGASDTAILPTWRDALARWSQTTRTDEIPAWREAQKRLRNAATSHS